MPASTVKRPIRVAGASGGFTDRQRAIHDLAKNCNVDVIVGGTYEQTLRLPKKTNI
jgi:hypothetical protein